MRTSRRGIGCGMKGNDCPVSVQVWTNWMQSGRIKTGEAASICIVSVTSGNSQQGRDKRRSRDYDHKVDESLGQALCHSEAIKPPKYAVTAFNLSPTHSSSTSTHSRDPPDPISGARRETSETSELRGRKKAILGVRAEESWKRSGPEMGRIAERG